MQKFGTETVVEFSMADKNFLEFEIEALNRLQAIERRGFIKSLSAQRSFTFGKDIVWSPIVGGPDVYCDQHKWENRKGQDYLNGDIVLRRVR